MILRVGSLFAAIIVVTVSLYSRPLSAQSIIEEWATVPVPPPPPLSQVVVDPQTTALLILDITTHTCNMELRPRCIAMLPNVKKLLAVARAKGLFVVYALGALPIPGTTADILPEAAMAGGEPVVRSGPDKYLDTNLDQILKDKGIRTVIVVGTASHGAVLHTAAGAVFRGLNVIIPVDGMAAESTYAEQYTVWHLVNAPRMAGKVKLTKIDMID
jgi:nicotinamidase-related amidase